MSVNVRHQVPLSPLVWIAGLMVTGIGLSLTVIKIYLSSASQPTSPTQVIEIVGQPAFSSGVLVNHQPVQVGTQLSTGQQLTTQAEVKVALQKTSAKGARLPLHLPQ